MGRELKGDAAPANHKAASPIADRSPGSLRVRPERTALARVPRWFAAQRERAPTPVQNRGPLDLVLAAIVIVALVAVAVTRSILLRVLLPLALAAAAIALVLGRRRAREARRPARPRQRGLALEEERLSFRGEDHSARTVLTTEEPFGVTLVATRRRDRLVAALTSSLGTFYVGAVFDEASRRAFAPLLARASTVASEEVGLDAIGPDGVPLTLTPFDLAELVGALGAIDAGAPDRFVLSDAYGAPIVLDAQELVVQEWKFDLSAPLEWRAIVFQEAFGNAVAVYQGTWIRQGGSEVVLVSLLSSIGPSSAPSDVESTGIVELDRAALRDLRFMQATPDEPPPVELRVAFDRVFMFPLRSALDRAPRPSSQPSRAIA